MTESNTAFKVWSKKDKEEVYVYAVKSMYTDLKGYTTVFLTYSYEHESWLWIDANEYKPLRLI